MQDYPEKNGPISRPTSWPNLRPLFQSTRLGTSSQPLQMRTSLTIFFVCHVLLPILQCNPPRYLAVTEAAAVAAAAATGQCIISKRNPRHGHVFVSPSRLDHRFPLRPRSPPIMISRDLLTKAQLHIPRSSIPSQEPPSVPPSISTRGSRRATAPENANRVPEIARNHRKRPAFRTRRQRPKQCLGIFQTNRQHSPAIARTAPPPNGNS
ncbi:hypothetical protein B0T19DRAFT_100184 [Cercophora scortea]|uniref:Uncharacterized protein n=1 Tax=Cercophora scortea TaxID=314031 RepID=A0AAE0IW08_9PEZI|nr:hypothetical protein B0T19DRAFT_100184 [Cercophora scortea]